MLRPHFSPGIDPCDLWSSLFDSVMFGANHAVHRTCSTGIGEIPNLGKTVNGNTPV